MDWNIRSDQPIYSQIVAQMKLGIVSGVFRPGERLASVRDMAAEAGVNPNTMQRALQELEREGVVYAMRTAGRFVTEDGTMIDGMKKKLAAEQVDNFLEAMAKLGYKIEEAAELIRRRGQEGEYANT